jgi:Terpene cyclase DEP1
MVSLIVHAVLGLITIAIIVRANRTIFTRSAAGPLELIYYAIGIASLPLCWYFNIRYVYTYAQNPFWGQANWSEFIKMGFANYSSSSQVSDYTIINVILLPLFTITDGLRRGIRHPWLFFVSSLFTSCAFALAFYFAVLERQRRTAAHRV